MKGVTAADEDRIGLFHDFDIQITGRPATRTNFTLARHLDARAALDTWGDVTFEYTSTDTSDFVPTAVAALDDG